MIKKIIAKLMNWQEQRGNNPERIHGSEQKDRHKEEAELAKERHDEIMRNRDRKYVSERTAPTDEEILGPSDSSEA